MEQKHFYGNNVHLIQSASLNSYLTQACLPETKQPMMTTLVEVLYSSLLKTVIDKEFPTKRVSVPTRMTAKHKSNLLHTEIIDDKVKAVSCNLARAGTWPSQVCYHLLNCLINPDNVRQDHVIATRQTDENMKVTHTSLHGSKVGGPVKDSIVLFPDPMGATGNTLVSILDHYKKNVPGPALKYIAIHLILTPEYLAKVTKSHPDLIVYALRLDRGLSSHEVLNEPLGKRWDQEKGLDENQYIVPGAGGIGEILNNSYV